MFSNTNISIGESVFYISCPQALYIARAVYVSMWKLPLSSSLCGPKSGVQLETPSHLQVVYPAAPETS